MNEKPRVYIIRHCNAQRYDGEEEQRVLAYSAEDAATQFRLSPGWLGRKLRSVEPAPTGEEGECQRCKALEGELIETQRKVQELASKHEDSAEYWEESYRTLIGHLEAIKEHIDALHEEDGDSGSDD